MATKKVENRGGKREGAGRKPVYALGYQARKRVFKEVEAEFKLNNTTFGRELAKLMNSSDKRLKLAAMSLYVKDVMPKMAEKDVNVTNVQVPQVFIPEKYPDSDEAPDYVPADTQH